MGARKKRMEKERMGKRKKVMRRVIFSMKRAKVEVRTQTH